MAEKHPKPSSPPAEPPTSGPLAPEKIDAHAVERLLREGLDLRRKAHSELKPLIQISDSLLKLRLK